jgi:hypothetical protein
VSIITPRSVGWDGFLSRSIRSTGRDLLRLVANASQVVTKKSLLGAECGGLR